MSKKIKKFCKIINSHLYDLDRVLNGIIDDLQDFAFSHYFNLLVKEISKQKNLNRENKDILGNYYSMCQLLELEYEKWDNENYESHSNYEKINSMYVGIYNSCNIEILEFLQLYDSENIEEVNCDDEKPITIKQYLNVDKSQKGWFGRVYDSINFNPGYAGISFDIKRLFNKDSK